MVTDCHIFKLLNLSRVSDSSNHLMQLIDNTKCNLCTIKLLEFESNELSNALIIHILFQKLEQEIKKCFKIKFLNWRIFLIFWKNEVGFFKIPFRGKNKSSFHTISNLALS